MTAHIVGRSAKCRSSGCMLCKARKKKCDGRKPTCVACERNVLLCRWEDSSPATQREGRAADKPMTEKCRPRSIHQPLSHKRSQVNKADPITSSHLGGPHIHHTISRLLFQHWFCQTADQISALRGPSNAFLTELPKLAVRYPDMVLPSLLALSGVHYGNKYTNPVVMEMAWSHLAQALRALKYRLTGFVEGDGEGALEMLVVCLMLSLIETCRGDTEGNYQYHLRAARPLLATVMSSRLGNVEDPTLNFVKELYAYLTCISDLTVDPKRLATISHGQDFGPLITARSQGMLVGCAYELFGLVSLVMDVCRKEKLAMLDCERSHDDSPDVDEYLKIINEGYYALYFQVAAWKAPEDSTADFANCGRLYQTALLICSDPPPSIKFDFSTMESHVESAMALLDNIPEYAPVNVTLSWPLAIFGSVTHNMVHRQKIRLRLQRMYDDLGLGNIPTIIEFLECLWRDKGSGWKGVEERFHAESLEKLTRRYGVNISFM